jgi:Domain of unknown function (DUF1841)
MFEPNQQEVRQFFCRAYARWKAALPLTPLDTIAADWIALHPEYHAELADEAAAIAADYSVEKGRTNPFLHLSMHLSITEQVSIDQPRGIKQAYELLAVKTDAHEAQHRMMDCLGEMIWTSQRSGLPPDGQAYIECVRRKALG